jgi:thioredoxin reductase (NADPH)
MASDLYEKRREQMFPKLSAAQLERLASHGQKVATRTGEILAEPGQRQHRLYVVLEGSLDISLPGLRGEEIVTMLLPGDFAGEMSTLRGVAGFVRIRVREGGSVLAIPDDSLRDLVQTDAEISEMFMRAFILRRMGLVASGQSEATLIGSRYSPDTLRLREFLTRNNYPYVNVDVEADADVQALLDRFHVAVEEVPVLIGRCGRVFRNPSIAQVADFLQMNADIDPTRVYDMVVVGAGPAGLAAAVYGASEGLDVLVVEANSPGGQAGTSSRIENYLGFPTGISGMALAGRALVQSMKFGANVNVACQAVRLRCDRRPYVLELSDGRSIETSSVVVATGARYRDIAIANLPKFIGAGIYYAATHLEAKLCENEEIVVVGGGNSAGQAAVFLAQGCSQVHIMVRSDGLSETMSRYLIRRIEENPRITVHARTEITELDGDGHLQRVAWRDNASGQSDSCDVRSVFMMTGAEPNTAWLDGCVALDDKKFVRTGTDLRAEDLSAANWLMPRAPYLLETSLPGIFAVGDVRSGSVKRVAAAVGEGSACVQFVHRTLREISLPTRQMAPAKAA